MWDHKICLHCTEIAKVTMINLKFVNDLCALKLVLFLIIYARTTECQIN